jgi:hypothetical protein
MWLVTGLFLQRGSPVLHKVSAASADSPTSTLEETRERVIDHVEIAFAVVGGVAFAFIAWGLLALVPEVGAGAIQALANRVPFAGEIIKSSGVTFTGRFAAPAVAFFGGGLLFWQARGLVRWVADHLFPPFDTDLLRPIGKAGALDPLWLPPLGTDRGMQPLPWVAPPRDSPRHAVWAALIAFLSANVGEGRFDLFGHPRTPFVRFRWTMLTGRPGAGKTRIATEIARARARRELLDRDDEETRAERRHLARGAWLRSAWPLARRHETEVPGARDDAPWHDADPWDAGWIVAASEQGGLSRWQNSRFDDGLLARLKAWRPRRPTVLVLDDPRSGDASRVIGALLDGERRYGHPVRLIVVTQTLPQDLVLKSQLDGSWSAGRCGLRASGAARRRPRPSLRRRSRLRARARESLWRSRRRAQPMAQHRPNSAHVTRPLDANSIEGRSAPPLRRPAPSVVQTLGETAYVMAGRRCGIPALSDRGLG